MLNSEKLNILIVNTQTTGGAALACLRLFTGLKTSGKLNARLLLLKTHDQQTYGEYLFEKNSHSISDRIYQKLSILKSKIRCWLYRLPFSDKSKKIRNERLSRGLDYFSLPVTPFDITDSAIYKASDIINLHWVADFLDYPTFFRKNLKPVVWTLHDMSPILGGEHYAEWYDNISELGSPEQRKYRPGEIELEEKIKKMKYELLTKTRNLYFICPSNWLYQEVVKSGICKPNRVHHIPNGINTDIFRPIRSSSVRDKYQIESSDTVLLFVADSLTNRRKGMAYLLEALSQIDKNLTLLAVGTSNSFEQSNKLTHVKFISLGRIDDEKMMAETYNAADFFVIPSLMDNLPNTVIESICCGTPVVGFPVGGIQDIVTEENGVLATDIAVNALKTAINTAMSMQSRFDRNTISYRASRRFDSKIQAEKYERLLEEIAGSTK
jgi:glycosyltransferase involved in cell wall biosynthesis